MNNNQNGNSEKVADSQSNKLLEKVTALFESEDYEGAIKHVNEVIETNPLNADALYLKATALIELKKYDDAIICYNKISEINPKYLDGYAWNDIGSAFFEQGEYPRAIEYYDRTIEVDPVLSWPWRNKGLALQTLSDYEGAIKCYNKAIDLDPNYVDAVYDKGNLLFELGKTEDAIDCFETAIKIDPGFALGWHMKGQALYKLKKTDEALKCYDQAIQKDPNNAISWNDKGNILYDLGKYNEAIICYDKVLELDPGSTYGWSNKALAMSSLGEVETLKPLYEKVVELSGQNIKNYPNDANLLNDIGFAYDNLDDHIKAEECYKEALKIDQNNIRALKSLGSINSDYKKDFKKALEIDLQLLKLDPNNFDTIVNYVEDLLKCKYYEEALVEALKNFSKATSDRDKCMLKYFILASQLLKGDQELATKAFADFFQYYGSQPDTFVISKDVWIFDGLTEFLSTISVDLQSRFILLTIIDLLQGNIKLRDLKFSRIVSGS